MVTPASVNAWRTAYTAGWLSAASLLSLVIVLAVDGLSVSGRGGSEAAPLTEAAWELPIAVAIVLCGGAIGYALARATRHLASVHRLLRYGGLALVALGGIAAIVALLDLTAHGLNRPPYAGLAEFVVATAGCVTVLVGVSCLLAGICGRRVLTANPRVNPQY